MLAHSVVAAVSDRRRRSEIHATIYGALYRFLTRTVVWPLLNHRLAESADLNGYGSAKEVFAFVRPTFSQESKRKFPVLYFRPSAGSYQPTDPRSFVRQPWKVIALPVR